MKKTIMTFIGIALFVAGYYHTRRQNQYLSSQSAGTEKPSFVTTPAPSSTNLKSLIASRLIKPS